MLHQIQHSACEDLPLPTSDAFRIERPISLGTSGSNNQEPVPGGGHDESPFTLAAVCRTPEHLLPRLLWLCDLIAEPSRPKSLLSSMFAAAWDLQ